jgi:hypothetical protein
MSPLTEWLANRPGRCRHGWDLKLQGCQDCGVAMKFAAQAAASQAHPDDRAAVDAAIRQLAATHQPFSANDARSIHGVKGGVVGAAFTAAHKAKLIVPCGDEGSTSGPTHGHRIYLWKGTAAA